MTRFDSIAYRSFDEAFEAKPGVKVVVGSGKGGVGKTTTNAGLLLALERKGIKSFGLDLDLSPSLELLTAAKRPEGKESHLVNPVAISSMDGFEIPVAQCSPIIPDLHKSILEQVERLMQIADSSKKKGERQKAVRDAENIIKDEYKRLADRLLVDEFGGRPSYLPLLRPALQPVAWNLGVDIKDIATAIQLIDVIANRRHMVFDLTHGSESVTAKIGPVAKSEVVLLDTENANHLSTLLSIVRKFRIFLSTLSSATGNMSTWGVATMLSHSGEGDIFKKFFQNNMRREPEKFFQGAKAAADTLMGEETFLVQTVNPATAVTEQTLDDIRKLLENNICPDFIAMTRWPQERSAQAGAKAVENDFLGKLDTLLEESGQKTSYKRLEESGIQSGSLKESSDYEEVQHSNMRIMANALVRD